MRSIDRDALENVLAQYRHPAGGVTLTLEEARLAREWYTRLPIGVTVDDVALAKKLEASE